jgi:tetratricopeptide (TPR) repeat protein
MQRSPGFGEALEAFRKGDLDRARGLAEKQLESTPESPQLQHLLGLIDCRSGQLASGVERLRRAFEAEPDNIAFRVMLVRALIDNGMAKEALDVAQPPAGTSPAELALWHARAEAADAAGVYPEAAKAWQILCNERPTDWRAWNNYGNALTAQENWAEAAKALSKAAELNPADAAVRRNAGSALALANRLAEAIEHFATIVETKPQDVESRLLLASALESALRHEEAATEFEAAKALGGTNVAIELGLARGYLSRLRFSDAEGAFRRALELEPTNLACIRKLGLVLERTNQLDELYKLLDDTIAAGIDQDELTYLRAVLARREGRLEEAHALLLKSDPAEDPIAWHALRAKIADGLGMTYEAFEAAAAMNRTARENTARVFDFDDWQSNANAYRESQHQLARIITPQWGARVPVVDKPPRKRVAFLVGFPRSGTTLLDTFLMGHPEIEVLEEVQLIGTAGQVIGPIEDLPSASTHVLEEARSTYFEKLAEHVDPHFDGLVVDKFPLDMAAAPFIHAMFPGAPIIFAQRHPCDLVLSGFMQPFGMVNFSDIGEAADYYDAIMSIWTASRTALPLNVHTVVYEELVENPEAVLRPLVAFLGLEWVDHLLDHQATAKARGSIVTPSYDQVTEPVSRQSVGRWRRYEKWLEPVLPILLPWAERLGYGR